jgi:hypothetical protein
MIGDKSILRCSVLLAFRARNTRSFRDEFELSMVASPLAEKRVVRRVVWRAGGQPVDVLPSAALYGANASGKTNVLRAINDMRALVVGSFGTTDPGGPIKRQPFRLGDSTGSPSQFEIDFVLDGVRHEYGFSIDDERVIDEWAYRSPRGRSSLLFRRHALEVEFGAVARGRGRAVRELLRPNALLLSTAAAANHPTFLPIFEWFHQNLRFIAADGRGSGHTLTKEMLDGPMRESLLSLLTLADLGITGANLRDAPPEVSDRIRHILSSLPAPDDVYVESMDLRRVLLTHRGARADVSFDAGEESNGTLTWFSLLGPIIVALATGTVLLVDELDASLHPALVSSIISVFQDRSSESRCPQLVFTTHDATLLGDGPGDRLLGRDQVWFTEKLGDGSSRLYSLADLDPRKREAIQRRYLDGRYGAVPIISTGMRANIAETIATNSHE